MKKNFAVFPALVLGIAMLAHAQAIPTKIGIIKVADAIQATADGQKAAAALNTKFSPKRADFEKRQANIQAMQDQLRKGGATLSQERQAQLTRDIDDATKKLNRDSEDAQTELDQEQGKVMQELGAKMMEIVTKYATDNGYAVIIDVSNPQTPVLWAASSTDITNEIVKLYDQKYAAAAPAAAAPAAAPPAAPPAKKK